MRDAEPVDPAFVALTLEPRKLLAPGRKVVDLLDLDPAEPPELPAKLRPPFLDRCAPDLGGHTSLLAALGERSPERRLRPAVHRRGVEEAATGVECRTDDLTCPT